MKRSRFMSPAKREGTTQLQSERRAAEKARNISGLLSGLVKGISRGTYAGSTTGAPIDKEVKAKPGKGAPNKAERAWMDAIVAHGCIACRIDAELVLGYDGVYAVEPPQVHHILRGGRRIGHLFTLPLCAGHHQQNTGRPGLVARHPFKARFELKYGTEPFLLARLQAEIGEPHV